MRVMHFRVNFTLIPSTETGHATVTKHGATSQEPKQNFKQSAERILRYPNKTTDTVRFLNMKLVTCIRQNDRNSKNARCAGQVSALLS